MIEQGTVSKSISYTYDEDLVQGDKVIVSARNPDTDEELEPKKTVPKDGSFAVAYPWLYAGEVELLVEGVDGGQDGPQTLTV